MTSSVTPSPQAPLESAPPEPTTGPAAHRSGRPVLPSDTDPVAAAGSEVLGGPAGRRIRFSPGLRAPLQVLAVLAVVTFAIGMLQKAPCYNGGWFFGANTQYVSACYSDIPHLYTQRGFADGLRPYFDSYPGSMPYLEYPVLTGLFMQVAAWITAAFGAQDQAAQQLYWFVNAAMLMVCSVVAVVATARTHRLRPWDALPFALAPVLAFNGTINWDMLAVALASLGLLLWARRHPVAAGVLIGLATAAKLYPVLLLGPLFILCLRAGRMREFGQALAGAAASWLAVNLPIALLAFDGWSAFYTFSEDRGEDYGTFWLILMQTRGESLESLNTWVAVLLVLCCLAIGALGLLAPRRPRLSQLAFLVVAAFALTNKVYSPQYVLWLLPLAVLARPRWRDFLIWQAGEMFYSLGVWLYLAGNVGDEQQGLPEAGYHLAITAHLLATLWLCGVIVRDVLRPAHDPVRADGSDDPAGGPLDAADDRFTPRALAGRADALEDAPETRHTTEQYGK
ncbi:glycosyltransferase family 87 protein [Allostreptomyces psammosilenae]|uniref:Putative membrane protein n=1 Tax=Allostreptomyces psammosilenae TaxID=1892865 RepID=A0A852ZSW8_9ACTN|nr:glycosyltransferase 87 family protein [Allostreptomyces psammosilenae]NYI05429.1 putative membrane protein [Allostreptomyces psammosilenae]